MKEASGELNMTVVTIIAIAAIAPFLQLLFGLILEIVLIISGILLIKLLSSLFVVKGGVKI